MNRRIAICIHSMDLGGAQIQALVYAKVFQEMNGTESLLLSLRPGDGYEPLLEQQGIPFRVLDFDSTRFHSGPLKRIREIRKVSRELRRLKVDVLIPFTFYPNVVCNLAGFLAGVPARLWNQRGWEFETRMGLSERLASKLCTMFLCNSPSLKEYITGRYGMPDKKIQVIPNVWFAREKQRSGNAWKISLGLAEDDLLVTMVANYFPEKEHELCLDAYLLLRQRYPRLALLLIGYSPEAGRVHAIKAKAFDLGLDPSRVLFLEKTRDIPGVLEATDIGLLATKKEGSPNVILDYMAAGLPVVASDIPPIREILGHLCKEQCFESGNADHLARLLDRFLSEPALRMKLGQANKERMDRAYRPDIMKTALQTLTETLKHRNSHG